MIIKYYVSVFVCCNRLQLLTFKTFIVTFCCEPDNLALMLYYTRTALSMADGGKTRYVVPSYWPMVENPTISAEISLGGEPNNRH
jgi:hypothetical protein